MPKPYVPFALGIVEAWVVRYSLLGVDPRERRQSAIRCTLVKLSLREESVSVAAKHLLKYAQNMRRYAQNLVNSSGKISYRTTPAWAERSAASVLARRHMDGAQREKPQARTLFHRPYLAHFCSLFRHLFAAFLRLDARNPERGAAVGPPNGRGTPGSATAENGHQKSGQKSGRRLQAVEKSAHHRRVGDIDAELATAVAGATCSGQCLCHLGALTRRFSTVAGRLFGVLAPVS